MDPFQRAENPWGQSVLTHISWDLFWLAVLVGAVFIGIHLLMRGRLKKLEAEAVGQRAEAAARVSVPEKVLKHTLVSRIFHWSMAVAMLVLLVTGFLPQVGLQFAWLTPHWIAGVVLIAAILFHIVHATFFQSLRAIWISFRDIKDWWREVRRTTGSAVEAGPGAPKYPIENKAYHHAVLLTGLGVSITGVLMMFRIDTPLLARNPYMFTDPTWGIVYVVHGLTAVGLVTLTIAHIYFAILPEKLWITRSMIYGWIARDKFLEHHDPERWTPEDADNKGGAQKPAVGAGAEAS